VVSNHRDWFEKSASASGIGSRRVGGVRADSVGGGELRFGFPRVSRARLSVFSDAVVDAAVSGGYTAVSVWGPTAGGPAGLGPRLLARGFEYGWQAHWMGLRLGPSMVSPTSCSGVDVVWDAPLVGVAGLPYGSDDEARILRVAAQCDPDSVWCATALSGDRVVGRAVGFRSRRTPEFAGVYSMGVVPDHRRRGIGSSLLGALADRASRSGCAALLLNSASDGFYASLGFESLGRGQTWWMHRPQIDGPALPETEIQLVEAVGDGDWVKLGAWDSAPSELFHVKLPGAMTLAALALRCLLPDVFDWLETRGAPVDLLDAWRRGERRRAAVLLRRDPEARERRGGAHSAPP